MQQLSTSLQWGNFHAVLPTTSSPQKSSIPPQRASSNFETNLQAVLFLWQNRLLHRDLKELNILIDRMGNARLIDFGSASGLHWNGPGKFTACSNRRTVDAIQWWLPRSTSTPITISQYPQSPLNTLGKSSIRQTLSMFILSDKLYLIYYSFLYQRTDWIRDNCFICWWNVKTLVNPDDRLKPMEALCFLRKVIVFFLQESSLEM